jgi:acyl-homoserine lactone acylase PvdQ
MPEPDADDRPISTRALLPPPPKRRRWPRVLLWTACTLVALVLVAIGAGVLWLRSATKAALPVLDGDLHLAGLSAPVTVRRDAHGVPHIAAGTEDDLFMAQGYVAAQDRLWQMDMFRRNANGELAEILGPSLVPHDRMQRVFQFRNIARRIYTSLSADDRRRLDDYARGVNAFIDTHRDTLPPEFKLLFYRPQPWAGPDSISIGLMMVQTLDTHWDVKLAREEISADLHNPKLEADLYPVGSWRDHPPTGIQIDLSQPHPVPPPTEDTEDDDEPTKASLRDEGRAGSALMAGDAGPSTALRSAQDDGGWSEFVASHPSDKNKDVARMGHPAQDDRGWSEFVGSRPSDKNEDVARMGHPAQDDRGWSEFVASHPSDKNKDVARMGHPAFEVVPAVTRYASHDAQDDGVVGVDQTAHEDLGDLRTLLGRSACAGCWPGSNNWVIAGRHTASGKPLLSNDMHLSLTEPNIWIMADLSAPRFHAAGVTLPGMPFVIAGHNDHVAWGFTALIADVEDLYIEHLDGKGNYQAADSTWKPLTAVHETIHVRGGKDVELDVQFTAHGPLMNPLFRRPIHPFSLKWTAFDPSLNSLPLYGLNTAPGCTEFTTALADWDWPTQNVVCSDDQGHIAYHAVGRVPLRPGGLVGVPIQDANHEWQGYIPFDSMPGVYDPPSGFLATANSRVTTDKSPYQLSLEWVDPYRAERIYKALQGRDQLTPKDLLAVQTDIYSEVNQELAHRFAYAIDHTPGSDARLRQAADIMRSWDGRLTTDSSAASLVTQARRAFAPLVLEPKLGKDAGDYTWAESDFAEEEIVMHASPDWLPKGYKNWDALLTAAVERGMEQGKAPADVSRWAYGNWHVIDIEHPLAGFLPLIGRTAGTGEQPLSGDDTTVKQVGRAFGPSQRFTMDWSNIDGSTENIVLGESGNPLSPYFRDQWNDYYNGTTFALPYTDAAVAAQTQHTLRLLP